MADATDHPLAWRWRVRPPMAGATADPFVWWWRVRLPARKGQRCRVLVRGRMNSVMVEFADGVCVITSRDAVRKAEGD